MLYAYCKIVTIYMKFAITFASFTVTLYIYLHAICIAYFMYHVLLQYIKVWIEKNNELRNIQSFLITNM